MSDFVSDACSWLQAETLNHQGTLVKSKPFSFLVAKNMLPHEVMPILSDHFPNLKAAGYLPHEPGQCGAAINALIARLKGEEFADALGNQLGIERLSQYPTFVSISRILKKRHGNIHTDGKSKIATALLYLNDNWDKSGAGCLRFLNSIDDIEDTATAEIPPVFGTLAAFKRADNSFHGHLPFKGERRVIQIAWLASAEDMTRKAKRGRFSHKLKKLQAWLGEKIGRKPSGST